LAPRPTTAPHGRPGRYPLIGPEQRADRGESIIAAIGSRIASTHDDHAIIRQAMNARPGPVMAVSPSMWGPARC
jgi:hypothetical protein